MSRQLERSLATLITVVNALGLFGGPPGSGNDEVRPAEPTAIVEPAAAAASDEESVTPEAHRCPREARADRSAETVAAHEDEEESTTDARN